MERMEKIEKMDKSEINQILKDYARQGVSKDKLIVAVHGLNKGLKKEQIDACISNEYSLGKMFAVVNNINNSVRVEDIKKYIEIEDNYKLEMVMDGLSQGIDLGAYVFMGYNLEQLNQVRKDFLTTQERMDVNAILNELDEENEMTEKTNHIAEEMTEITSKEIEEDKVKENKNNNFDKNIEQFKDIIGNPQKREKKADIPSIANLMKEMSKFHTQANKEISEYEESKKKYVVDVKCLDGVNMQNDKKQGMSNAAIDLDMDDIDLD